MRKQLIFGSLALACLLGGLGRAKAPEESPEAAVARPADPKMQKAYALIRAGRKTEAIATLQKVLKEDPENLAALAEMGYLSADQKRWPQAIRYFKRACALDSRNMKLRMDLGYALQQTRDYRGAQAEFALVAKEPGEFQNQAESALNTTRNLEAAAVSTKDAKQAALLEKGYAALREGNRQLARSRFQAVLARDPKDAAALKQIGYMNLEDGRLREAARNFSAARAVDPEDQFITLQLGYVYQRLDRPEQAREAFTAARESSDPKIRAAAEAALSPSAATTEIKYQPVGPAALP
jgi:Flp pilus assembly protein TadD